MIKYLHTQWLWLEGWLACRALQYIEFHHRKWLCDWADESGYIHYTDAARIQETAADCYGMSAPE